MCVGVVYVCMPFIHTLLVLILMFIYTYIHTYAHIHVYIYRHGCACTFFIYFCACTKLSGQIVDTHPELETPRRFQLPTATAF